MQEKSKWASASEAECPFVLDQLVCPDTICLLSSPCLSAPVLQNHCLVHVTRLQGCSSEYWLLWAWQVCPFDKVKEVIISTRGIHKAILKEVGANIFTVAHQGYCEHRNPCKQCGIKKKKCFQNLAIKSVCLFNCSQHHVGNTKYVFYWFIWKWQK